MKKKKHTGLKIFSGLTILLLLVAAVLVMRFYPIYRDAEFLAENLDFQRFSYELETVLNREKMQENQVRLLDMLAELTGLEREAMYHLNIRGSVDGDIIHAEICPRGQNNPLIELYLSDSYDVVNGALLYNAVRSHYASENELIAYLAPVWSDREFVSLEQLEEMLDIDLGAVRNFRLSFPEKKLSVKELFAALAVMEREKSDSERCFTFTMGKATARLKLDYGAAPEITAELEAESLSELLTQLSEKLSKAGISLNDDKLSFLNAVSLVAETGEGRELQMPEDLISRNTVEVIAGLRRLLEEISGKTQ